MFCLMKAKFFLNFFLIKNFSFSKTLVTEDRKWRQEKLYKQMTDRCIDGLVIPLRRLQLTPEELVTLKILLLFSCGNHTQKGFS